MVLKLRLHLELILFFVVNLLHESEEGLELIRTVPRKVGPLYGLWSSLEGSSQDRLSQDR